MKIDSAIIINICIDVGRIRKKQKFLNTNKISLLSLVCKRECRRNEYTFLKLILYNEHNQQLQVWQLLLSRLILNIDLMSHSAANWVHWKNPYLAQKFTSAGEVINNISSSPKGPFPRAVPFLLEEAGVVTRRLRRPQTAMHRRGLRNISTQLPVNPH